MKSAGTNLIYISAGNYTRGGDDLKVASGLGSARDPASTTTAMRSRPKCPGSSTGRRACRDRAPMTAGDRRYFGRVDRRHARVRRDLLVDARPGRDVRRIATSPTGARSRCSAPSPRPRCSAPADPVGRTFLIREQTFTVAGVTDSKIEDQPESVFVPFTALQEMRGGAHLDTHHDCRGAGRRSLADRRSRRQPCSACATGSALATAGRRRRARRLHHQDRGGEGADQGALHVGGRLRAGQPAAAR